MANHPIAKAADESPFEPSEAHLSRIRERAYHLWEQEGRPDGRADEYWERARELVAMSSGTAGLQPNPMTSQSGATAGGPLVEEASLQDNLGEFPGCLTDQGDTMPTPRTRKEAKAFRSGRR